MNVFADEQEACRALAREDAILARALAQISGQPHIRQRSGGYGGLFRIIIEQQISVPSAQAVLKRCYRQIPDITPEAINALSEKDLRGCGLSGPKVKYVQAAAIAVLDGTLDLASLPTLTDQRAVAHLCSVKGIGPWSAAIYLLFCEGRVDIWPRGDVALLAAYAAASGFTSKPAMKDFDAMAEEWSPWRGIAAHILWTYYAKLRGRAPI